MTAGQGEGQGGAGGQHGAPAGSQAGHEPAWAPPYGQSPQGQPPPYGQPPYGQPPQGQPPQGHPPYGQYGQAPHGYQPAPAAPWGRAPEPMDRPVTVRAGVGAFVATIVLGLISSLVIFLNWDQYLAQALAQSGTALSEEELALASDVGDGVVLAGVIFGLILNAAYALFVWFTWKGHNWARIVLWVLGGIFALFGLLSLGAPSLPFLSVMNVFTLLLTLAGIVLLALKPSNDWFRYRSWQRTTGQR